MNISLIYENKILNFKLKEKCYKTKIKIFSPMKSLSKIYKFIIKIENFKNNFELYQVEIDENLLTKFIKNSKNYLQYKRQLGYREIIFRFTEKKYLKEVVLKE